MTEGKVKVSSESKVKNRYGNFVRFDSVEVEGRSDRGGFPAAAPERVHVRFLFAPKEERMPGVYGSGIGATAAEVSLTRADAVVLRDMLNSLFNGKGSLNEEVSRG